MMDWIFGAGVTVAWLGTEAGIRAASFYALAGWSLRGTDQTGEIRYEMTRAAWRGRAVGR
jgi:hypothetical protein